MMTDSFRIWYEKFCLSAVCGVAVFSSPPWFPRLLPLRPYHPQHMKQYTGRDTRRLSFQIFPAFLPHIPYRPSLRASIYVPLYSRPTAVSLGFVIGSAVLQLRIFFSHSTITTQMADMDISVNSVIQTYQQHLNSNPYVPSTTYGHATVGADGVANKLFIAFQFSDSDVGVQFLKDVGLIQSSMGSSASLQPCTGQSNLRSIAVMSLPNYLSPETSNICRITYYIATNPLRRLPVRLRWFMLC